MSLARRILMATLAASLASCVDKPNTGPGDGGDGGTGNPQPANSRADWTNGAVVYEVFVRSFQDSNGDGVGDLKGLISRLDYLNDGDPGTTTDLGVDALWLMPVFQSPSYHGYDTSDYEQIESDYGTNADFQQLVQEAHRRGIKIVLDFVMNHTSSQHPWFIDSASGASAAHRSWYPWLQSDPGWRQPWGGGATWHQKNNAYFYGVFYDGMPDLNYRNTAVREEMKRLARLWLDRGADGFRLDAARYLIEDSSGNGEQDRPDTHAYWKEWAASVRAARPDALIVGEVWADTTTISSYYGSTATVPGGDELPLNFDFPLATAIISGINASEATGIAGQLRVTQQVYAPGATDAPFLTNHDHIRVATQLSGNVGREKNAAAILLTVPGTAFLYYGEEVGALNAGGGSADELKRAPMAWDATAGGGFTSGSPWYPFASNKDTNNVATQSSDPGSLLSRYRKLIHVRKASSALTRGDLQVLTPTSGSSSTLAFLRTDGDERVLVVHNLSDSYANDGPYVLDRTTAEPLFVDGTGSLSGSPGNWRVSSLPPRGTGIWRMR